MAMYRSEAFQQSMAGGRGSPGDADGGQVQDLDSSKGAALFFVRLVYDMLVCMYVCVCVCVCVRVQVGSVQGGLGCIG